MTVKTATKSVALASNKAATLTAPKPHAFTGKLKVVRQAAFAGVASLAYAEGKSRADTITQLRLTLGAKPTENDVAACRIEYIVGRVAQRFADVDLPSPTLDVAGRIAHARNVVTLYAAPVADGVKANKLRAGQLGRRTVSQHKIIRAAEEAWSQVKAELGIGAAKTQAVKNKAKRAPQMSKEGAKASTVGTGITHTELVKADGPMDKATACQYLESMAATMLAFCNKHAAVLPTDYGMSVKRFNGSMSTLAKARNATENTEA
jgi:hypothetical protein